MIHSAFFDILIQQKVRLVGLSETQKKERRDGYVLLTNERRKKRQQNVVVLLPLSCLRTGGLRMNAASCSLVHKAMLLCGASTLFVFTSEH